MDSNKGQDAQQSSQSAAPRLPRSYNLLIQLSRTMGGIATKSSIIHDVRSFMNQEISISPSEKVFGNTLPRLTVSRPESNASNANTTTKPPEVDNSPEGVAERAETKQKDQRAKDLKQIVTQSHDVLMSANTVFPITLFPDTITIDRTKVTITRRDFFWTSDVLSIRIEDVLNVQVSVGPLFGSLTIASRVMSTIDHFKISHLWRNDAIRLKHMIQGYVIAQHNKIETAHLEQKELIETVIELGNDTN